MELLAVSVSAPVASFRRPLDLNYQRTLPLPPPTTLLGLAGAALGLSDRELWGDAEGCLDGLKVSALIQPSSYTGTKPGIARDMWKILKIKANKIADRSPYFRELLFYPRYTLLFGGSKGLLKDLAKAFQDPAYPLSLGREDELLWIEELQTGLSLIPAEHPRFCGTAVPGDIRKREIHVPLREGIWIEPPVVETVPLAFKLDSKGVRSPARRGALTFLPLSLSLEIRGIQPVYVYKGRCFTWMNP